MDQLEAKLKRFRLLSNLTLFLLLIMLPVQVWRVLSDYSWQKMVYLVLLVVSLIASLYFQHLLRKIRRLLAERRP